MKYLLFAKNEVYYASGGAHDIKYSGNNLPELIAKAKKQEGLKDTYYSWNWWHIYDTEEMRIVAGSETQPYGADDLEIDENGLNLTSN